MAIARNGMSVAPVDLASDSEIVLCCGRTAAPGDRYARKRGDPGQYVVPSQLPTGVEVGTAPAVHHVRAPVAKTINVTLAVLVATIAYRHLSPSRAVGRPLGPNIRVDDCDPLLLRVAVWSVEVVEFCVDLVGVGVARADTCPDDAELVEDV